MTIPAGDSTKTPPANLIQGNSNVGSMEDIAADLLKDTVHNPDSEAAQRAASQQNLEKTGDEGNQNPEGGEQKPADKDNEFQAGKTLDDLETENQQRRDAEQKSRSTSGIDKTPDFSDQFFGEESAEVEVTDLENEQPNKGQQPNDQQTQGKPKPDAQKPSALSKEQLTALEQHKAIMGNKALSSLVNAVLNGVDPIEYVDAIRPVNVENLIADPETAIMADLKLELNGKEPSSAEYEREVQDFKDMSPRNQRRYMEQVAARMQQERTKKFGADVTEKYESPILKQAEMFDRYAQEVPKLTQSLIGKEIYGLTITDKMAKEVENFCLTFNPVNEDGTINSKRIMQLGVLDKLIRPMMRKNWQQASTSTKIKALDEISRPDSQDSIHGRGTSHKNVTGEDMVNHVSDNM